ncbi:hypothetical protein SBADM41S_06996 [Streptomyces badius]
MSDARAAAEKADEKSADRLTTLSDGIFAIAMTLLVLDLHVEPGLDKDEFIDAVRRALPDLGAYALSFTILAGFWRDHRLIVRLVPRFEGVALRFALMWLGAIALVPFPTALLSEYAARPLTVAVYAGMVAVTNLLELAMFLTGGGRSTRRRPPAAMRAGRSPPIWPRPPRSSPRPRRSPTSSLPSRPCGAGWRWSPSSSPSPAGSGPPAAGTAGRAERERDGPAPGRTYRPRRLLPAGRRWGDPAVRSRYRPVARTAHPHSILISYLR